MISLRYLRFSEVWITDSGLSFFGYQNALTIQENYSRYKSIPFSLMEAYFPFEEAFRPLGLEFQAGIENNSLKSNSSIAYVNYIYDDHQKYDAIINQWIDYLIGAANIDKLQSEIEQAAKEKVSKSLVVGNFKIKIDVFTVFNDTLHKNEPKVVMIDFKMQ